MRIVRQGFAVSLAVVAMALASGCYSYEDSDIDIQPAQAASLGEALSMIEQADQAVRALTAQVEAAGNAMDAAGAAFEAALEVAETNESIPALELAVADALIAIEDADAAAVASDEIGANLAIIASATTDAVRHLQIEGAAGMPMAETIVALAADAENSADAAFAALDTALEGMEVLVEELEGATELAGDLGAANLEVQLEAEVALAEAAEALIEGAEGAIEAAEGSVDAAVEALELAMAAI